MNESHRRLAIAAYIIALYFIVTGAADALTNVWPWNFGDERWRYGFAGVSSGYLVAPLFGFFIIVVTATTATHRLLLRVTSVFILVTAAITLVWLASFILDVLQLHNEVSDELADSFRIGSTKTLAKLGLATLAQVVLGIAGLRAARALSPSR